MQTRLKSCFLSTCSLMLFYQVELTRWPEGRNARTVSAPSVDEPAASGSSSACLDYISASTGTVPSPQFHMSRLSPACLPILRLQTSQLSPLGTF